MIEVRIERAGAPYIARRSPSKRRREASHASPKLRDAYAEDSTTEDSNLLTNDVRLEVCDVAHPRSW